MLRGVTGVTNSQKQGGDYINSLTLRDYQSDIIGKTYHSMATGHKRPLVVSPTGSGKTAMFAWMADAAQKKGSTVWFLVHRKELYDQTESTFKRFGIPTDEIYIGMVGQVARNSTLFPKPDLIVYDECFPAGTLIDGRPIESMRAGDTVCSFNHKTKQVEHKRVTRVFVKALGDALIRINQSLVCTPDHPIFIKERDDYVEARNVRHGESMLLYVQEEADMVRASKVEKRPVQEKQKDLLFSRVRERVFKDNFQQNNGEDKQEVRICEDERKQPNVQPGFTRENEADTYRVRIQADDPRWKRKGIHKTSKDSAKRVKRSRFGRRIYSANKITKTEQVQDPNTLQNRHRDTKSENRNRNRWSQSLRDRKASSRSKERTLLRELRVESVEILQRGSYDEFESLCPDGYVYNLEVEGNNNYFANDILVHNCHHSSATTWQKITDRFPDAWIVGLTATPCRLDGKPLGQVYDDLVEGITTAELIRDGYLSQYRCYSVPTTDASRIGTKGKDYDMVEAADVMMDRAVYGDVIKHYQELAAGTRAICFCTTVKHSEAMAEEFRQAGIDAVHFDGTTPKRQRKEIVERFRQGEIQVLCNVDLISEGFDMPACDAVILLRPTQSLGLYLQQVGRSLRPAPDKVAIILDHVGNAVRHGLPDDPREWSLTDTVESKPKFDEAGRLILRTCESCYAVYPNTISVCPLCGEPYQTTRAEIEQINAVQLKELKRREEAHKENWNEKRSEQIQTEQDCKTYNDLVILGKQKGVPNVRKWATSASYRLGIPRPWERGRR